MVSPVIFFEVVTGIIFGFQYFTQAYVVAGGQLGGCARRPAELDVVLLGPISTGRASINFKMGYASAMAWVLLIDLAPLHGGDLAGSRRWVHYQGGAFPGERPSTRRGRASRPSAPFAAGGRSHAATLPISTSPPADTHHGRTRAS